MRWLVIGMLGLTACADGGSSLSGPGAPVRQQITCPWAESSVSTTADLGEVVDVSFQLVERNGFRTTVRVVAVEDSHPIFTPEANNQELVLEPYEHRLIRQFVTSEQPGVVKRTLRLTSSLKSSLECDEKDQPVVLDVRFQDGDYRVIPDALVFQPAPVGTTADGGAYARASHATAELINNSRGRIAFALSIPAGTPFSLGGVDNRTAWVEPGSRTSISVRFEPTGGGDFSSTLRVSAGSSFQKSVALVASEGGPFIVFTESVDFGVVPYLPGAQIPPVYRRLMHFQNIGHHPTGRDAGGDAVLAGAFELFQLSGFQGAPTIFQVKWHSGGVWAQEGWRLAPGEEGTATVNAVVQWNGPASDTWAPQTAHFEQPARFRLEAQILPPCSTSAYGFPLYVPLDGGFTDAGLINNGNSACIFDEFGLEQDAGYFELLEPEPFRSYSLFPGESLPVRLRATAQAFPDAGARLLLRTPSSGTTINSAPITAVP